MELRKCIYCGYDVLYKLSDGNLKCASCKRKISLLKIKRLDNMINSFCSDLTALEASKRYKYTYVTCKKYYDVFRSLISQFLEQNFNERECDIKEFDEYFYLEESKKRSENTIFDVQNFLTFDYGGKVYSILMPSLIKYRENLLDDGMQHEYYQQFSRFITFRRIAKLEHLENTIVLFWNFFENSIKKYKGIDKKNFFYYLKEFEFKFNYTKDEQKNIINELYKLNIYQMT